MSSTAGWQSDYIASDSGSNSTGWGASGNNTYSSPISNPDSWPQLGDQEPEGLARPGMHQQPVQQPFSNMQQQEVGGWGGTDVNKGSASNGWGSLPAPSQTTGWGNPDNASSWSRPQVDNGTAVWGKSNQSAQGWTAPTNQGPTATAWNVTGQSSQPSDVPIAQAPNLQQEQQQNPQPIQPTSNTPSQGPESWAAAAAAQPGQVQSNDQRSSNEPDTDQSQTPQTQQSQEQKVAEMQENAAPAVEDPVQKIVNSHEGWGKRPIQQNTSWDITESPNYPRQPSTKTGTEAWGKIPPSQAAGGWQGNAGGVDPNAQWDKPATVNRPVRGWGVPNQVSPQPRPPWSGAQPNPSNQQTGWSGEPRMPPPMSNMNNNRWSTPPSAIQNAGAQGWAAPPQQGNTATSGWGNPPPGTDNSGWGAAMQRNPQSGSSWGGAPAGSEGNWNQQNPNVPMQRVPSQVDNGTSAWGDPNAYKSVNMWDKKTGIAIGDSGQNKPEATGWGAPAGPAQGMVNKPPSPTGWGDANPNRPMMDNGASVWNKGNGGNKATNWDQNSSWGQGKPNNTTGWGSTSEQPGQPWGQSDPGSGWNQQPLKNDMVGGREFGFMDRKTSTGSDSVFEEGQGDGNGQNLPMGMSGNGRPGMNFNQFQGGQPNNPGMPGMNGPRPVPPQPIMNNMQGPMIRGPPMPPQLQNQLQQIRHAVMKGVIPQRMLNPQLMTPQHLNHLQQLVMKTTERQQLLTRMNLLNKPNLPPQLRPQQEQIARMLQQCQQQIQAHQHALTQNMLQKTNQMQMQGKTNTGGMGPGGNLGLDLGAPTSSTMPPGNSPLSPFNMSNLAQNLPGAGTGSTANREQQSRLNTWKRPSIGMESPSDNGGDPHLHASISDMIGEQGGLQVSSVGPGLDLPNQPRVTGGGLLGLQQPDGSVQIGEAEPNGLSHKELDASTPSSQPESQLQGSNTAPPGEPGTETSPTDMTKDPASPNLKNILADIGPPEFIPGVKWKGFRPIDPENDPDITPGSVAIAKTMSVNTVKDVDQVLNRDRYTNSQVGSPASASEIKPDIQSQSLASSFANNTLTDNPAISSSTWSSATGGGGSSLSHPPTSLTHELWKVPLRKQSPPNSRPPQGGFPSQNSGWSAGPASTWSSSMPNNPSSSNRYPAAGGPDKPWSDNKTWVVLTGLNPQVDLTTLRSMCSMKGNMLSFQPNYPMQGMVLIKYATTEESLFAQKALNMFVMGNIMLVATIASDQEVSNYMTASSGNTWSTGVSGQSRFTSRHSFGSSGTLLSNHQQPNPSQFGPSQMMHTSASTGDMQRLWSSGGNSGAGFGAPPSSTSWSTGNPIPAANRGASNSLWSGYEDPSRMMSPLHSLLPENLLGEQSM